MFSVRAASLSFGFLTWVASVHSKEIDLSVLGEPVWTRLRPGWSLTVNDQCLYEFVFQFEHDKTLPLGEAEFKGTCFFGEKPGDSLGYAADGKLYLEPRQMWERFPDYVWATIGFNHLSIDWRPCGQEPRGYSIPQYDFSVGLQASLWTSTRNDDNPTQCFRFLLFLFLVLSCNPRIQSSNHGMQAVSG